MTAETTPWIRSAFWTGKVKAGAEDRFRQHMESVLVPSLKALPGVQDVSALWPRNLEDSPPTLPAKFLLNFPTGRISTACSHPMSAGK